MHEFFVSYLSLLTERHGDMAQVIDGLAPEALAWSPGAGMNSLQILVVHTAGAERYWIGDVAGQLPSGRVRAQEFATSGWTVPQLKGLLEETLSHSRGVVEDLSFFQLKEMRLSSRNGRFYTVAWALNHALEHTALHLGHMQIGRQLWEQRD
ncbi:MAG: DUF664 domain-containing protein [Candidatus Promineifilaceae bacterium]|nr:DUF664 domain-containing protein [Candidatus Promineifilaceae bacterium]